MKSRNSILAIVLCALSLNIYAQDPAQDAAASVDVAAAKKELIKNLKNAKINASDPQKPDFKAARNFLSKAVASPVAEEFKIDILLEAANLEYNCYDVERNKPAKGGKIDLDVVYNSTAESFKSFSEAYDLILQSADKKYGGKVKSNMQKKAWVLYTVTNAFRANAVHSYEKKDWARSHQMFDFSVTATESQLLKDFVDGNSIAKAEFAVYSADSTLVQTKFNRAVTSVYQEQHEQAIKELEEIKFAGYEPNVVFQELCNQYVAVGDSAGFLSTLVDGMKAVPEEPWYSQNLMNVYLSNKDYEGAATIIDDILQTDPQNPVYLSLKGQLLEVQGNAAEALQYFEKSYAIDSNGVEINSNLGRSWYNKAAEVENEYFDKRQYNLADSESLPLYIKSMQFYEAAFKFDKKYTDKTIATAIRTVAYKQFSKTDCSNKDELIDLYNRVSRAYGMPEFGK